MAEFQDIKSDYEEFWLRAQDVWQPFNRNAQVALQAYSGRTWTEEERKHLRLENRYPQEFNLIRPQVQLFSGYMRDNIKSTIIGPVEGSDQKTADQFSEVMRYVYDKGDANAILLNAFDDCLKTGIALVGMWIDYSQDPINGDIKFYKRSFNSFIVDPNFEKADMSDAAEVLLRDFVTREDAKSLLPFVDPKVIDDAPPFRQDNKFQMMRSYNRFYSRRDLLSFDQYYRKVTKNQKQIVDLNTGDVIPFFGNEEEEQLMKEKLEFGRSMGIEAELVERPIQTVELNILLSGEVVYTGPDPLGINEYPFVPTLCYFEPQLDDYALKIQGVALSLVDTQRAFNKRMIRKEDVMDTAVNTGFMYKVGEVDVEDIRQTGAGKMIPVNSALPFSEVMQPMAQGQIPPGWQEESQFLLNLGGRISGVNESLLGLDEGGNTQVSGRLAEVRAANGLRANRSIFDNFERTQKYLGSKVLKAIQVNYGPGKIERILNEQPTEQFYSQDFDRYDAVIKQGVYTQSQRDAFYFEILRLIELFGPEQIPVSLALENLPMAGASDVQEAIKQKEQAQQQAQQMAQEEAMQQQRSSQRLTESVTQQNLALAQERRAKVISDIALAKERVAASVENRANAAYDRARTISELAELEDNRLLRVLEFARKLQQDEFLAKEAEEQALGNTAQQVMDMTERQVEELQPTDQAEMVQQQQTLGGLNV